jgi:formate hydrogenlyase subunit 3/multisubunit Na+/H+ antiporter MnhD subunit
VNAEGFARIGFGLCASAWIFAFVADLLGRKGSARALLVLGTLAALAATLPTLVAGTPRLVLFRDARVRVAFHADAAALWLMLPALVPALFAVAGGANRPRGWAAGAALALLGALGVFGLQDGASFLIAWELMALGTAAMLLAEHAGERSGRDNLFMLALLEAGGVTLLLAVVVLGRHLSFSTYAAQWATLGAAGGMGLALLWLVGCGAKLGILPFYEWYPGAYAHGSGASGALVSGVVLNAAYFALGRALLRWLPAAFPWETGLGVVVLAAGVLTAILSVFHAFQEGDWRRLLAFSSAENAALSVTALGAALIFRAGGQPALAALAWIVGMLNLMGHSLAKGALFFASDAARSVQGDTRLRQGGLLRRAPRTVGVGAVLAAMSLAALPPTAGFVSEWYLFQTLFHGFALKNAGPRIALVLAGAGLALAAAVALATAAKLVGVGLLGRRDTEDEKHERRVPDALTRSAVLGSGLLVLLFAVSMVGWLPFLGEASWPDPAAPARMVHHWLLVPLSAAFAFISPLKLVLALPLFALLPLALLTARKRYPIRRAPVWCGGDERAVEASAMTALAFSNALRVFYSFLYRPRNSVSRQFEGRPYFLKELRFDYTHVPIFGPLLFDPLARFVRRQGDALRFLQNGLLNAYLASLGLLLLLILGAVFLVNAPAPRPARTAKNGTASVLDPRTPRRAKAREARDASGPRRDRRPTREQPSTRGEPAAIAPDRSRPHR